MIPPTRGRPAFPTRWALAPQPVLPRRHAEINTDAALPEIAIRDGGSAAVAVRDDALVTITMRVPAQSLTSEGAMIPRLRTGLGPRRA